MALAVGVGAVQLFGHSPNPSAVSPPKQAGGKAVRVMEPHYRKASPQEIQQGQQELGVYRSTLSYTPEEWLKIYEPLLAKWRDVRELKYQVDTLEHQIDRVRAAAPVYLEVTRALDEAIAQYKAGRLSEGNAQLHAADVAGGKSFDNRQFKGLNDKWLAAERARAYCESGMRSVDARFDAVRKHLETRRHREAQVALAGVVNGFNKGGQASELPEPIRLQVEALQAEISRQAAEADKHVEATFARIAEIERHLDDAYDLPSMRQAVDQVKALTAERPELKWPDDRRISPRLMELQSSTQYLDLNLRSYDDTERRGASPGQLAKAECNLRITHVRNRADMAIRQRRPGKAILGARRYHELVVSVPSGLGFTENDLFLYRNDDNRLTRDAQALEAAVVAELSKLRETLDAASRGNDAAIAGKALSAFRDRVKSARLIDELQQTWELSLDSYEKRLAGPGK